MKYLIRTNADGCGDDFDIYECDNQEQADKYAYEKWRGEAEDGADYEAKPLTRELAEDHGFEDELDEGDSE